MIQRVGTHVLSLSLSVYVYMLFQRNKNKFMKNVKTHIQRFGSVPKPNRYTKTLVSPDWSVSAPMASYQWLTFPQVKVPSCEQFSFFLKPLFYLKHSGGTCSSYMQLHLPRAHLDLSCLGITWLSLMGFSNASLFPPLTFL